MEQIIQQTNKYKILVSPSQNQKDQSDIDQQLNKIHQVADSLVYSQDDFPTTQQTAPTFIDSNLHRSSTETKTNTNLHGYNDSNVNSQGGIRNMKSSSNFLQSMHTNQLLNSQSQIQQYQLPTSTFITPVDWNKNQLAFEGKNDNIKNKSAFESFKNKRPTSSNPQNLKLGNNMQISRGFNSSSLISQDTTNTNNNNVKQNKNLKQEGDQHDFQKQKMFKIKSVRNLSAQRGDRNTQNKIAGLSVNTQNEQFKSFLSINRSKVQSTINIKSTSEAYQDQNDIKYVMKHVNELRNTKSLKTLTTLIPSQLISREKQLKSLKLNSRKKTLKFITKCIENEFHKEKTIKFYQLQTLVTIYISILLMKNVDSNEYNEQILLQFIFHMFSQCEKYGLFDQFLQHQKKAFMNLQEFKSALNKKNKLSYTWLKNSLLLDYTCYELIKIDCKTPYEEQFNLIVKSIRERFAKSKKICKDKVHLIQKSKLKILLQSTMDLYLHQQNGTLDNQKSSLSQQEQVFQELSKVIRMNKEKEIELDYHKFSMDGCFEAMIVDKLNLNRKGMLEIKKRPKPIYQPFNKGKEEIEGFRTYFKLKKELQDGNFDRKALGTWEDIHAFMVIIRKKRQEQKEEKEFLKNLKLGVIPSDFEIQSSSQKSSDQEQQESDSIDTEDSLSDEDISPISRLDKKSSSKQNDQKVEKQFTTTQSITSSHQSPIILSNKTLSQKNILSQNQSQLTQNTQAGLAINQKRVTIRNRIEMKKLHDTFKRRQALSKDMTEAKLLQQTLLEKLNSKKLSLIDQKMAKPSHLENMRKQFGDVLKFDDVDSKKVLSPQEASQKFLNEIKHNNDTKYWANMIKFNKGNHAFREAFKNFMFLVGEQEQPDNSAKNSTKSRQTQKPRFLSRLLMQGNYNGDDNESGSTSAMHQSTSSINMGTGSTRNKHKQRKSVYFQDQKDFATINEIPSNRGLSKTQLKHLQSKVHKDSIKDTLQSRQEDLNQMVKNYNITRGIFDQEDMREMQSAQQRRNLTKILNQIGKDGKKQAYDLQN
eukprot:403353827